MKISHQIARILLQIKAVNIAPTNKPFTLTSGKQSPVYVDCRSIIGDVKARNIIVDAMALKLNNNLNREGVYLAGGETAGIPYAAFLAQELNMKMLYVRKKPKGFGKNASIEGMFDHNDFNKEAVLIEDMATDGASKVKFVAKLQAAGFKVDKCLVPFYYDIFPPTKLEQAGIKLDYLCTWHDILHVATADKLVSAEQLEILKNFMANPAI
jgi:orotate phosphoribosyltransferase